MGETELIEELAGITEKKAEILILLLISNSMSSHGQAKDSLIAEYKELHERENRLIMDF